MSPNEREFLDWLKAQRKTWEREVTIFAGFDDTAEGEARGSVAVLAAVEAKFRKAFLTEAE